MNWNLKTLFFQIYAWLNALQDDVREVANS